MERKIVFFDIDGTLITERTHRLPESAVQAVLQARKNGHLMFINTGRTRYSIDPRLINLGFDGFVCGCGTNVFIGEKELFHREFSHEKGQEIIELARDCRVDILLEARDGVYFDWEHMVSRPCRCLLYTSRIPPGQIIVAGFGGTILLGTLLLMLPFAARSGESTGFMDAFFTATSATCVTGLVVFDTYSHWTVFGQAVILALIQIGGMGVVTMAIAISIFTGKRIGLKQRFLMQESISAPQAVSYTHLTRSDSQDIS